VLDNVMLGTEPMWQPFSRRAAARARLRSLGERFALAVDPDARVGALSVGQRQRAEILKALYRDVRILILDEPTAVLTPQESESLFATLRGLCAEGLSIVFISHKLDEVLRVSQRIAVLRSGRLVMNVPAGQARAESLAEAMVGRALPRLVTRPHRRGETVCALSHVSAGPPLAGGVSNVSLALHAGEITGIAGVSGNGQAVLAELLSGMRAPEGGTLRLSGNLMGASPRAWIDAGVARVPEDRHAVGVIGDLTVWENAIAEHYRRPFASAGFVRRAPARGFARRLCERFDVRGGGIDAPARTLSGGNMQKLILGRALSGGNARPDDFAPVLIVASQPTHGLDIGAVGYVHQRLLDACARGAAVLLISDDLDEVLALSDKVAVMQAGRLTPPRAAAAWTRAELGLAMAGAKAAADAA
jgi:simple sugar transport system ATP-binding protein